LESVEHETKSPEADFTTTPSKLAPALYLSFRSAAKESASVFAFSRPFPQPVILSEVAHGTW
jgi:hypothetical protein